MKKKRNMVASRGKWKIAVDAASVFLGFIVALAVRFEFSVPSESFRNLLLAIPIIVSLYLVMNAAMRIYAGRWKYASFDELLNLVSATMIATAVLLAATLAIPGARNWVPLSVSVTGGVLVLFIMTFIRLQYRVLQEMHRRGGKKGSKKVLLVGAGEAGEIVARDMLRHPEYDYSPVGFIDDDKAKSNLVVQGIPVLGGREEIPKVASRLDVDEIIITITSITGDELRQILPFCEKTGAKIKILPGIFKMMAGEISVFAVRDIKLEDLLGRPPVETDLASISAYVTDKVVMVTGAGGSIGSELSCQLSDLSPKELLLLDNDETSLYDLEMNLRQGLATCPFRTLVADIRDIERLSAIFKRYRPQVVFHSAALKHVPLMEQHPSEAVKNNIMGTRNLAAVSTGKGVERFILISTDKAVHPANVMGATKRVAEMLIKEYGELNHTIFTAVRFGNVLGSRGSVVPTFKKQIEDGGPVLVTHAEATRYFMTIDEAAQLVIQAGAFTEGSDIFILDMGEPVCIMDLAHEMVRLMGRENDMEVRVTGLRPGEKLHEELSYPVEAMVSTPHPKIDKAVFDLELPHDFQLRVDELIAASIIDDEDRVRLFLSMMIPSYKPSPPGGMEFPGDEVWEAEKGLEVVAEQGQSA